MKGVSSFGCSAAALAAVWSLATLPLHAERDAFFTGTGRDGTLTVNTAGTVVNVYAAVTANASAGSTSVTVSSTTGMAAGDLVLLLQTTGLTPAPTSGTAGPTDLTASPVGRWELARVTSVTATTLNLLAPLTGSYAAGASQVVRVPEYTSVTINASRSIAPSTWNGATGGVTAFLVSGTLTNNGSVNASGRGFRGGQSVNDTSGATGASGLDEAAPRGAQKGEGLAPTRYGASQTGRGRVSSGAGGGVASKSGGGGGGHAGAGGQGGNSDGTSDGARAVGGQGGTAVISSQLGQLLLGGGGGAGHTADGTGTPGAAGGGIIFIRAGALAGSGTYLANGAAAGSTTVDAGSGGGAGGMVYLRVAGAAASGTISATGAFGGNVNNSDIGPGGGGGGGRIVFQKNSGTAAPGSVSGGAAGTQQNISSPLGVNYGAAAGSNGIATTLSGAFPLISAPVLTTPGNGSAVPSTTSISGTAAAGLVVHILVDGTEIGAPTADGSGSFTYTPSSALALGVHTAVAYAEDTANAVFSVTSNTNTFTVAASDADLISLVPSAGTLAPVFASSTTGYTAEVTRNVSSITLTPTVSHAGATVAVRVNGGGYTTTASGTASGPLALNLGDNTLDTRVTAQDGVTQKTYTLTLRRLTYLEAWRRTHYGTTLSLGSAADTAAPKQDGISNLMKFALGMNPAFSGVQPVGITRNTTDAAFTYPRSVEAAAECTFTVEWSETLLPGSWSSSGVTEQILSDNGLLQQVKATVPAGSLDHLFIRLRVTNP